MNAEEADEQGAEQVLAVATSSTRDRAIAPSGWHLSTTNVEPDDHVAVLDRPKVEGRRIADRITRRMLAIARRFHSPTLIRRRFTVPMLPASALPSSIPTPVLFSSSP